MRLQNPFNEASLYKSILYELFIPDDDASATGFTTNCPDNKICRIDPVKLLKGKR